MATNTAAPLVGPASLTDHLKTLLRRCRREVRTILSIGPAVLRYHLSQASDTWRPELPVQSVSRETVPIDFKEVDAFRDQVASWGLTLQEGADSLYLAPAAWRSSPLASLAGRYPADAGLKISKAIGDADTPHNSPSWGRKAQSLLSATHREQVLLFNLLYAEQLSPRLYDLVELQDTGGTVRCAYIVQHVAGGPADADDRDKLVEALRTLCGSKVIAMASGDGFGGVDFKSDHCNGNLLKNEEGDRALFVDPHNFRLDQYGAYLDATAKKAAAASHFGEKSLLTGGAYLYQSVPGTRLPAKRSPTERMKSFDAILAEAGLDVRGRALLDVGCNMGLMGAEYLRRGASWMHGWDRREVVPWTERVLLGVGCTRFSLTGGDIDPDIDLSADLPPFVRDLSAGEIVMGYFAIRLHIGWLKGLKEVPWRYMIYEGHQNDRPLEDYVGELSQMIPTEIVSRSTVADANTTPRDIAILRRL